MGDVRFFSMEFCSLYPSSLIIEWILYFSFGILVKVNAEENIKKMAGCFVRWKLRTTQNCLETKNQLNVFMMQDEFTRNVKKGG